MSCWLGARTIKHQKTDNSQLEIWKSTYVVPAILVLMWVMSSGNSFANPKSPIFGEKSFSRRILLALMSLCTICGTSSSWRNARPLAVPMQIADLFPQSSIILWPASIRRKRAILVYKDCKFNFYTKFCWIYLIVLDRCCYFLHIHRPKSCYFHEHNTRLIQQGLGAWHLI